MGGTKLHYHSNYSQPSPVSERHIKSGLELKTTIAVLFEILCPITTKAYHLKPA